jgi:hypothetical protein
MYLNYNSSNICIHFVFWWYIKHILLGHNTLKHFDRDSNLKICLWPGLDAQKVEDHWSRAPDFREPKNWKISDKQSQKTNSNSQRMKVFQHFRVFSLIWFWGLIMPLFTSSIPMGILISNLKSCSRHFWPLLNWASFLEAAGAVVYIGLSLKSNHHK